MKKIQYFLIQFIMFSYVVNAQTVKVTDQTTLQALPLVAIHSNNPNASTLTNMQGLADLKAFKQADSIYFTHMGYVTKMYGYQALSALNFRIALIEKPFSLDEIVVSASRFEEKMRDVAQPIQVIKSRELAFINQQTMADVIQNSGNVLVQKSQLGGGSPIIRGFETNKVLMVVDGVRMNNAIYRGGHIQNILTLDNAIMDKVEIVFGPGSVVYGSDALGGVMHFYTKDPVLGHQKANAFTRFSSASNEKTAHFNVNLARKKLASLTSVTASDFGDLRQGNERNPFYGDWGKRLWYVERIANKDTMMANKDFNIQKQSGYKQLDIVQKFLFKQSSVISHLLNIQYSTSSNVPRYDRLTLLQGTVPRFAEWYYGPQKRFFASYTLQLKNENRFYNHGRVIIGYQQVEESRHERRFKNNSLRHRIENLDIFTFNADFAKNMQRHELRYGLDAWYNNVNSSARIEDIVNGVSSPLDTRYPSGGSTMKSLAGYTTYTYEINEKMILNSGIRANNVQLRSKFTDKTFFPFPFDEVEQNNIALNGNIGLIFMPDRGWRVTFAGSSGFRAPNVDDLSKVFESVPGRVVVPNPNLKPEFTKNIDIGFSKSIDGFITVGANAFYTWYTDAITTIPGLFNGADQILYNGQLSWVSMNVNAAKAYIYGGNAYFDAGLTDHFSINSTLNYTFGRIKTDTTDYPLDHIAPVFGKTSFNLKMKKFRGEFFVQYSGAKKAKDYNLKGEDNASYSADPINGYMPAWLTLNLRTAYQFNENFQIQLALENILDQNYRVFASNISSPGRNFVVTLRGAF